jgi:hypothetical protein
MKAVYALETAGQHEFTEQHGKGNHSQSGGHLVAETAAREVLQIGQS